MFSVTIRVTPGASRTHVGGSVGEALRVRVTAPAVDGRANDGVIAALAKAFGVRPRDITIRRGATARTKTLDISGDSQDLAQRLSQLLVG